MAAGFKATFGCFLSPATQTAEVGSASKGEAGALDVCARAPVRPVGGSCKA